MGLHVLVGNAAGDLACPIVFNWRSVLYLQSYLSLDTSPARSPTPQRRKVRETPVEVAGKPAVTSSDICLWLLNAPLAIASCCAYSNYRTLCHLPQPRSVVVTAQTPPSPACRWCFSERLGLAHGEEWVGVPMKLSEHTEARFPPCNRERLHNAPDTYTEINTTVLKQ